MERGIGVQELVARMAGDWPENRVMANAAMARARGNPEFPSAALARAREVVAGTEDVPVDAERVETLASHLWWGAHPRATTDEVARGIRAAREWTSRFPQGYPTVGSTVGFLYFADVNARRLLAPR